MKLLLVEDDQNMSRAVSELLRQEHYIVDVVSEGNEAEDYILSDDYDIVILDVMLPDRSGYEITKAVRSAGNRTPILFLTAKSATADTSLTSSQQMFWMNQRSGRSSRNMNSSASWRAKRSGANWLSAVRRMRWIWTAGGMRLTFSPRPILWG